MLDFFDVLGWRRNAAKTHVALLRRGDEGVAELRCGSGPVDDVLIEKSLGRGGSSVRHGERKEIRGYDTLLKESYVARGKGPVGVDVRGC